MYRIELYVKSDNRLSLSIFDPIDSEYEKHILEGAEAYNYLEKLYNNKIIDIKETITEDNIALVYDNYIISINEQEKLLNKRALQPLVDKIKKYYELKELKKVKGKKVTRKNKYVGKRIAAASLATLVIGTTALGLSKLKGNQVEALVNDSIVQENIYEEEVIPDDKIDIEYVKEDVVEESQEIVEDIEDEEVFLETDSQTNTGDSISIKIDDDVSYVSINYEDRSNTQKAINASKNYGAIINKYATMYGIDPILALAVATQESGVHSSITAPGGATGLMQIQNSVWIGSEVSAYNFQTQSKESFVVTLDKIQDLEYNIKIGCMILQNSFVYMKYNTLAAVQCYNMGYGNMMKILNSYASDTNKTIDEILSNQNDTGWLDYRNIITCGDNKYIENVMSWIGEEINIKNIKYDGTLVCMNLNNDFNSKKVY